MTDLSEALKAELVAAFAESFPRYGADGEGSSETEIERLKALLLELGAI
jgi:hypothetical protein